MAGDDTLLFKTVKDISGGINTRQHPSVIQDSQMVVLYNVDIGVAGESSKRLGSVQIANDIGSVTTKAMCNYERQGYADALVIYNDKDLWEWDGSSAGATSAWASISASAFTQSATSVGILACKESGLTPDDIIIVQNETESKRFHKDSSEVWAVDVLTDDNDSIPKTSVMAWYGNRVWTLKNDLLSFSDAYPSAYSSAFDRTTNAYRVPVGKQMGISPTRDTGMVILGENAIWGLAPSATPVATDKPEPLVTDRGCVAKDGWKAVGDDIFFFSQDGLRSLKRTVQDKLQLGVTYPISYPLKTEFSNVSWANIANLTMEYFDNKLFIAVPKTSTTYDTWVYYPASNSFMVIQGLSPAQWVRYKVNGEERLYYAVQGDAKVYRGWYGYTDEGTSTTNGTAINYQEEGKKDDLGQAQVKKWGGELSIRAVSSGNYNISVYASFDDGGYNLLGTLNLSGNLITFPVTFPVTFLPANVSFKKFHLDAYGEWYKVQIKLVHNATNTQEITILERTITAYPQEYDSEEES